MEKTFDLKIRFHLVLPLNNHKDNNNEIVIKKKTMHDFPHLLCTTLCDLFINYPLINFISYCNLFKHI